MRAVVAVLLLASLLLPLAAAGTSSDPEVADAAADVTRGQSEAKVNDALARSLDVRAIWLDRDDTGHYWTHMRITDLSGVASMAVDEKQLSLQYAVTFAFASHERDFQVSATTGGSEYATPPGSWRCMVLDLSNDQWTDTGGWVDVAKGTIHVRLPAPSSGVLADGNRARNIGGSAWGSVNRDDPQTDDKAQAATGVFYDPAAGTAVKAPTGSGLERCGQSLSSAKSSPTASATNGSTPFPVPGVDGTTAILGLLVAASGAGARKRFG